MKKQFLSILIAVSFIVSGLVFSSFMVGDGDEGKQEVGGELVVVRTYEIMGSYPSQIIFAYQDGTTETVELESLKSKYFVSNLAIISVELNKLKNKGFKLISTNGGVNQGMVVNTYVFQKD